MTEYTSTFLMFWKSFPARWNDNLNKCGKALKDPKDDPIYIPNARMSRDGKLVDEYYCNDKCMGIDK